MNELYLEVLPLKHLWLGGGSGSSGGGGGTTTTNNTTNNRTEGDTTTKNEMLRWEQYVPGVTSGAYNRLVPQLEAKANQGLTSQEMAYYTGKGMNELATGQVAAQKSLAGNLARSGVRGGSVAESYGDLARSSILGQAGMLSNIQGMDINQKGVNTDRLMKAIGLPTAPVIIGSQNTATGTTTGNVAGTTNYAPARSSGGGGS